MSSSMVHQLAHLHLRPTWHFHQETFAGDANALHVGLSHGWMPSGIINGSAAMFQTIFLEAGFQNASAMLNFKRTVPHWNVPLVWRTSSANAEQFLDLPTSMNLMMSYPESNNLQLKFT